MSDAHLGFAGDEVERAVVAFLVVVGPTDEAMLAHHDCPGLRVFLANLQHRQAQFEPGPHPGEVIHLGAEDFAGDFAGARRRGDGDDRVGVHVIDMFGRDKTVQRRVDGRGARVEIERAMMIHGRHVVFGGRLETFVGAFAVKLLKLDQLGLVERGEIVFRRCTQITAGAFDPEDFNRLAGERVSLGDLGGSIAAAGVGDALVGAQLV